MCAVRGGGGEPQISLREIAAVTFLNYYFGVEDIF